MFIKFLGILCVLFSSVATGVYFAGRFYYRAEDLATMRRAMVVLKNQIIFYSMPLPEGMREIAKRIDGNIGKIFSSTAIHMEERRGEDAQTIWKEALLEWKGKTFLATEDFDELLVFGKTLGYLDRKQQESAIDMLVQYLIEKEQHLRQAGQKNGKLYCSMGFIIGMLMVVVLL